MMMFQHSWLNRVLATKNWRSTNRMYRRMEFSMVAGAMFLGLNWCVLAYGQTDTTWIGGSNNWNNSANWSGGFVPDNGNGGQNWNVFIDNDNLGNSTTLLDVSSTINQLHISSGDLLNIGESFSLRIVGGVLNNAGTININSGGNPTALNFGSNATIGGTGTINMSGSLASIGGNNVILTNGASHTISGSGNLGADSLFIVNQGVVEAGSGYALTLDPINAGGGNLGFNNTGTVRATGTGVVSLSGVGAGEFGGIGSYQANGAGARIDLINNVVVQNTTLAASLGGEIRAATGHSQELNNVSLSGNFVRQDSGVTKLSNTINNSGTMTLNWGGNETLFRLIANTSLTGGGTVHMNGGGGGFDGTFQTLTNVDNTISGSGNLGSNSIYVTNQGIVEATSGYSMTLDPQNAGGGILGFTNSGIVRATGTGVVSLSGNGAGEFGGAGSYQANGVGARIDLINDVVVQNTTLAASLGGEIRAASGHNQELNNVSLSGNFVRQDSGVTRLLNTINNSGTMTLNFGGNPTLFRLIANTSFTGGGTVHMTGGGGGFDGTFQTLTNVDNTISGSGNLGSNSIYVTNQGIVEATSGFSMTLDPANAGGGNLGFDNLGTVRAMGTGVVSLSGNGAGEFGGTGSYQANGVGARIDLINDVVVQNTTLAASLGGEIRAASGHNQELNNVSLSGNFVRQDSGVTRLLNTINNSGTMTLNFGGNPTLFRLIANTSFTGGGTVHMTGAGGGFDGSGQVLTNVNNTISGSGNLGFNSIFITNQGTVEAGSGFSMTVDPANAGSGNTAFNNEGIVRALANGVVSLSGNGAGEFSGVGSYQATGVGARIDLINEVIVRNTTLAASSGGEIRAVGGHNQELNNVSIAGNFVRQDSGVTRLLNTINNLGTMSLNFGGNPTRFSLIGDTSLTGGGSVHLTGGGGGIDGSSQTLTNVNNTISGSGNLGFNSIFINNQGTIEAGSGFAMAVDPANAGGGNLAFNNTGTVRADGGLITLTGSGAGEFGGTGLFEARNGGTLQFDSSAVVQNLSGGVLNSGTWRVGNGGGAIRIQNDSISPINTIGAAATVELIGTGSNLFVQSIDIPIDNTLNNVQGNLILRNGRTLATAGLLSNSGNVLLDGSGTVLQVNGDFNQTAGGTILQNQSTLDLNGINNIVSGGVLSGNGTVDGDLLLIGTSVLDPGLSAGRIDFGDGLTWGAGARVRFDLGVNSAASDFITVGGQLLKAGSGDWAFTFVDNGWLVGQTYDLIDFGTTDFDVGDFAFTNGGPFQGDFFYNGSLLQFKLNVVPEPPAGIITIAGMLLCLGYSRRKHGVAN